MLVYVIDEEVCKKGYAKIEITNFNKELAPLVIQYSNCKTCKDYNIGCAGYNFNYKVTVGRKGMLVLVREEYV